MPELILSNISLKGTILAPYIQEPEFSLREKESYTSAGATFGFNMSSSGDSIIVGAYSSSKAYIFNIQNDQFNQVAEFTKTGRFGFKVAIDGDWAAVTDTPSSGNGSVSVYRRTGDTWSEFTTITIPAGVTGSGFASSVSISGTSMIIGHTKANSVGGAHIYVFNGTSWIRQGSLLSVNTSETRVRTSQNLGGEVVIDGNIAVVGGSGDTLGRGQGIAFISRRVGSTWSTPIVIKPSTTYSDGFGWSISLVETKLAIGAPVGSTSDDHTGRVFLYDISTQNPMLTNILMIRKNKTATVQDTGSTIGDSFGWAVRISETHPVIAVGAPNRNANRGTTYLLEFYNNTWGPALVPNGRLTPTSEPANGRFGSSLSFIQRGLVIGAYGANSMFLFE